jgi:hypothetical protein
VPTKIVFQRDVPHRALDVQDFDRVSAKFDFGDESPDRVKQRYRIDG